MPWTPEDATKHTKKADSPKEQRQWAAVADSVRAKGASDASAIKQANAVIAHGRYKGGK